MNSLPIRVGLVDMTGTIDPTLMAQVAAALNTQVTRDLPQYWNVNATVAYLPHKDEIPQGVWPVQIVKSLPPGEGGFHLTKHNQPYAKVINTPDSNEWTVDASHETIEMLVDSAGNRLQASTAIEIHGGQVVDAATGKFEYLVEVCDPCEADDFTYRVDGFSVSDFITPHFYDAHVGPGTRYSFTGAITRPRELLKGGYISFVNTETSEMQQILWVDPSEPPQLNDLGPASGSSLRAFVETQTYHKTHQVRAKIRSKRAAGAMKDYRTPLAAAAKHRAKLYV